MSLLFAATYPERARALVLYGSFARHPTLTDKAVLQRNLEEIESGARERLPVISVLHGFLRNQAPRSGIYEMDTAAGGAMHALVVAHAIARLLVCLELPVDHKAGRGASEKNRFCHAWTMPVGVDVGFALDQDVIGLVT